MMEFRWDHQGPHYPRYSSIPERTSTYDYRTRRQGSHCPFYYGEQQDSGTECSYWTVPGSRRGRALQDSANQIFAPSNIPYFLDSQTPQQRAVQYLQHEARVRERAAAQQAARQYDGAFLGGGWQRSNREMSGIGRNGSYRELKAWATQRSLTLPRRKNIEEEPRGSLWMSNKTPERDSRTWTNFQVNHQSLDRLKHSAKIRESNLWDGGYGQQTLTSRSLRDFCPPVDTNEMTHFQKMMFSQPPGYIAPPPYDSPHTTTPAIQQGGSGCETERHEAYVEVEGRRRAENKDHTRPIAKKICNTTGTTPGNDYFVNSLNLEADKPMTAKVIEGKRFRIRKKTGGLTIFCLVSRIADATELPPSPLYSSRLDVQDANLVKDTSDFSQTQTFADEVDFKVTSVVEPQTPSSRNDTTEEKNSGDCQIETSESPGFGSEENSENGSNSTLGRRGTFVEHMSLKYPLWKTPSLTRTAATERENPNMNRVESHENNVHQCDNDIKDVDIGEDSLLVPDACVVKMELVPSPKKDHVCYLSSNTEENTSSSIQEVNSEAQFIFPQKKDTFVNEFVLGLEEKTLFTPSFTVFKKETLEERAERILGISVESFITEKHQDVAPDLCSKPIDDVNKPSLEEAKGQISDNSDESLESCQTEEPAEGQDSEKQEENEVDSEYLENSSQVVASLEENIENSGSLKEKDINMLELDKDKGLNEQNLDENPVATNSSPKQLPQFSSPCQSVSSSELNSNVAPPTTDEDPSPEFASLVTSENCPDSPSPHHPGHKKSSPISSPLHLDSTPESEQPPSNDEVQEHSEIMISDAFKDLKDQDAVSKALGEESDVTCEGQTEDNDVPEKQHHSRQTEEAETAEEDKVDTGPLGPGETTAKNNIPGGPTPEMVNVCLQHSMDDNNGLVSCEKETFATGEMAERDSEGSEGTSDSCQTPDQGVSRAKNDQQEDIVSRKTISSHNETLHLDSDGNLSTSQSYSLDSRGQVQAEEFEILQILNSDDEISDPDFETSSSGVSSEPSSSSQESKKDSELITINDCQEMDCPSNMSTYSHDTSGDLSLDLPNRGHQYPKSLWDAVNRIRKHTAPDSETEEEEVGEPWDPEVSEEDLCSPDSMLTFNLETLVSINTGVDQMLTGPCDFGQSGCAEDDTLSCCSFSSQSSGETVIGEEEEVERRPPNQGSSTAEEEQGCREVSDERE